MESINGLYSDKLLVITGLKKVYPGAIALSGVDLEVEEGEVHCLVGQNGAGKSTLIKCIAGVVQPTEGEIKFRGEVIPTGKPAASLSRGVAAMYQELDLVNDLTVAENIFLGHEKHIGPFVDRRNMAKEAVRLLARLGDATIRPDQLVAELSPAHKQLVSMARALSRDVKLLIMDEPTAVLDPPEVDALFDVVERLTKEEHVGVIYISHRLEEIERIGSRITVLRDGATVASNLSPDTDVEELINLMVGQAFDEVFPDRSAETVGEVAMSVDNISGSNTPVFDASFEVHKGEILGIGGLVGAGRTELLRLIFGLDPRQGGKVTVHGQDLPSGRPDIAITHGVGLAPEERKSQALWLAWSQIRNADISDMRRVGRAGFTSAKVEREKLEKPLESLSVYPKNPMKLVSELSGGNQQKVVLARWLFHDCKVLLLDEPTRGVDVGARADVYRVINELAQSGIAIVVVSSELAELVGFCDRTLIMREGRLVANIEREHATEQELLRYALGAGAHV